MDLDVTFNHCLFPQRSGSRRPWQSGVTPVRTSCSLNLRGKRRPLVSCRRMTSWMTAETASSARWSLLFTGWHNVTPSSGVFFKHLFSPCAQSEKDVATLEPWLLREMDACISNIFLNQDAEAFIQLFNLILNENISGNEVICALKNCLSWSLLCFSHVLLCSFSGLRTQRDERHASDGGRRSRVPQPDGAAPEHGRKRQHQSLQRLVRRAQTF